MTTGSEEANGIGQITALLPPSCRRSGLWRKQCPLFYSAVGLLADEPLLRRRGGILGLNSQPCSSVLSCRSCARMIAANITVHPMTSLTLRTCPRTSQPPTALNTDSRLITSDATTGWTYFSPMIWRVYATPQDRTPQKRSGPMQFKTAFGGMLS